MQPTKVLVVLVFLVQMTIIYCQTEEGDIDESAEEQPLTAAEQYIDFITSGGKEEEVIDDENDVGVPPVPEGYEEVNSYDSEEDYSLESLDLLLKHYRSKFEGLPVSEIKSKLTEDIKEMDLDGDGQITKAELTSWFIKQAEKGSALEAEKLAGVKSYDTNKDQKLSWEEIFEDLKKLGSMGNPTFKRGIEMEKVRFQFADKDKDGFLNDSEYGYYATPEYFSHMDNYTILSYIHDYDRDGDWKVSREEYLKAFDEANDPEGYKIEAAKFDQLDTNKDGFLSAEEVYNVAMEFTLTKFVDKHANMLFLHVDADKDGKLSNVEIITNYPMFTKGLPENVTDSEYKHDEL